MRRRFSLIFTFCFQLVFISCISHVGADPILDLICDYPSEIEVSSEDFEGSDPPIHFMMKVFVSNSESA